jgi:hypothetical protein
VATEAGAVYLPIIPSAKGFLASLQRTVVPDAGKAGVEAGKRFSKEMTIRPTLDRREIDDTLRKISHKPVTVGVKVDERQARIQGDRAGKAVSDGAKKHAKSLSGIFAGAFAGVFVASSAIGFFKNSIAEGTDQLKLNKQTEAVIKSTGAAAGVTAKQVANLATKLSLQAGVADDDVQSIENMLLTFKEIKNTKTDKVFNDTTAAALDMATAMKIGGRQAALQLGKALNDPIKGVTRLQRVGVTFTDGQKEQIKNYVKLGQTAKAQGVILHEVQSEFGGSAAAVATPADKMRTAWHALQEQVGLALLPQLAKLANFATTTLLPAFSRFVVFIQTHWPQISEAIHKGIDPIIAIFRALIGFAKDNQKALLAFGKVVLQIAPYVIALVVAVKLFAAAQVLLNAVMSANPVLLVVAGLATLTLGVIYAYKHVKIFRTILNGVFSYVREHWRGILQIILLPLALFPVLVWKYIGPIKGFFTNVFNAVTRTGHVVGYFFSHTFPGYFISAYHSVTGSFSALGQWFSRFPERIRGYFRGAKNWLVSHGRDIINGLGDGIKSAASNAVSWIEGPLNAILGLLHRFINKVNSGLGKIGVNIPNVPSHIGAKNGTVLHFADGGVTPGYTPGRDVHQFYSPTGGSLSLSGGEAVMRPEWTRAVGGAPAVKRMNDAARLGGAGGAVAASLPSAKQMNLSQRKFFFGGVISDFGKAGKWVGGKVKSGAEITAHTAKMLVEKTINSVVGVAAGAAHKVANQLPGGFTRDLGNAIVTQVTNAIKLGGGHDASKLKGVSKTGAVGGVGSATFTGSGSVHGWIVKALQIMGMSRNPSLIAGIGRLISSESGGNPNAINLWDSNAKAGHPSKGLMQTIATTFAAYVWPALRGRSIYDPVANITAGVRYAIANYGIGMLMGGGRHTGSGVYQGYHQGGIVPGFGNRDTEPAMLTPGELVVPKNIVQHFAGAKSLTADDIGAAVAAALEGGMLRIDSAGFVKIVTDGQKRNVRR